MTTPNRCVPKAKVVARDITALKSPWHALDDACATPESRDAIAIVDVHVGTDRTRSRTVELSSRATRLEVKTLAHALERSRFELAAALDAQQSAAETAEAASCLAPTLLPDFCWACR